MMGDSQHARREAARLFASGASRAEVARRLGISRATATRWFRLWQEGGETALRAHARRGRPSKLLAEDLRGVQRALARSPQEADFDLERWSLAAVVEHIRRVTGVAYHPRHVARVLRRSGWVVLPVGGHASHAFREEPHYDPDGNRILLREAASCASYDDVGDR